jgi:hypothetical protein
MIQNTNIEITGSIVNPDATSIRQKSMIDITINPYDIVASEYSDEIKLNYNQTEIVLLDDDTSETHDTYFTPLYNEKINYEVWKRTINKSFQELSIQ